MQVPAEEGNNANDKFLIGSSLDEEERKEMAMFLKANIDVFMWQLSNMPGIEAKVLCHKLHVDKNFKHVKQKPRRMALEKAKSVEEEVQK